MRASFPFARALAGLLVLATGIRCGGSECFEDADCGPDGYCEGQPCPRNGLGCEEACGFEATCEPRRPQGEDCSYDGACVQGLRCNQGVCLPVQRAGGPCIEDEHCVIGTFCSPGARLCTRPGSALAGFSCEQEIACGPDLTCAWGRCLHALREGSPCELAPESCEDGLVCDGGSCRAR